MAIVVFAIAISLCTATALAFADANTLTKLRAYREYATSAPPTGALAGLNYLDNSVWVPEKGNSHYIVLFAVAAPGEAGDVGYWNDVAARSQAVIPSVQFVGLCSSKNTCGMNPSADGVLTLLSVMDPTQMHSLSLARNEGKAFVFRNDELMGPVVIHKDAAALSAALSRMLNFRAAPGGA